ncbi:MAG: hypothetical protein ABI433_08105 [Burkholderiaceae bacterium]
MTTVSLSFNFATMYAPQATAKPAADAARKTPPVPSDDSGCDAKRPAARHNRLEQAMLSALRDLGFGGTTATPATPAAPSATAASTSGPITTVTTPAATTAATTDTSAPPTAGSVESAVHQFAHALFQALRQSDSGKTSSDDDSGRAEGHRAHRHHHHEGRRYGDVAQRLEALSQTVGASASATTTAPASTSAAAEGPAGSSLSVTLTVDDGTADTAAPATTVAAPVVASPAPAPAAKHSLLDAFTKLFNALKPPAPASTTTPAVGSAADMAEKLRQFLHSLAQAMAPDAMGSVQHAQVGGLVNVTA